MTYLNVRRKDLWWMGIVVLAALLFSLIAYRPWQLYFFGDTWDILSEFHEQGWPTAWRMHNEHFMPVSKAVLYLQYQAVGMHNLPYQLVNLAIHAMNAVLLYLLAGEITCHRVARLLAALFFAFSGVYWELTMWEAGQQTTLALLFILLSLALGAKFLETGHRGWLAGAAFAVLLASGSMGFGYLAVPLLAARALASPDRWKRGLALSTAAVLAVLAGIALLVRTDPSGVEFARGRASLDQLRRVIPWTWTALRGLLSSYAAPPAASILLCAALLIGGLFFWRTFLSRPRLAALFVPASMLLLPHVLTSAGRVQLGIALADSSRYQYLPAAAVGLILAWIAGGAFEIAQRHDPKIRFALTATVVLTLPLDALAGYRYVRDRSPMFEWGNEGRRFVDLAVFHRDRDRPPAGMDCVRPEFYLPLSLYPHPFFDLSRALPLYARDRIPAGVCRVSLASALSSAALHQASLAHPGEWRSYAFAVASPTTDGATRIELAAGSAYGLETACTSSTHPYSFAASVRWISGDPGACMRILFRNASGGLTAVYPSPPISSPAATALALSALPPANTVRVAVDVYSAAPAVIAISDAVLVEHPVYLPATSAGRSSR